MDREKCKYFLVEDVTPWHGDVFDHPSYEDYCTKDGEKKELCWAEHQCGKCQHYTPQYEDKYKK